MTDPTGRPDQTGRRRLWPRVLLFVSLALNLLVLGIVVGALVLRPDHDRHRPPRDMVAPYTRALSDTDRREIGRRLRDAIVSQSADRGVLAEDYRAALGVLRSDPLDEEALEEVLSRQAERAHQRQLMGQRALVARLAAMSAAERAAYAARLEAELDRLASGADRYWRRRDR